MPLYRVTAAAGGRVVGRRVSEDDLMILSEVEARYEVDLGHLAPTSVEAEARPLVGLTDAERAALPRLEPLGDGPVEYAVGYSEFRASDGTGTPMVEVPAEPDGHDGVVGHLTAS